MNMRHNGMWSHGNLVSFQYRAAQPKEETLLGRLQAAYDRALDGDAFAKPRMTIRIRADERGDLRREFRKEARQVSLGIVDEGSLVFSQS